MLLKALLFLCFHKVHIKHKGIALYAFFLFFYPRKDLLHKINENLLVENDISSTRSPSKQRNP